MVMVWDDDIAAEDVILCSLCATCSKRICDRAFWDRTCRSGVGSQFLLGLMGSDTPQQAQLYLTWTEDSKLMWPLLAFPAQRRLGLGASYPIFRYCRARSTFVHDIVLLRRAFVVGIRTPYDSYDAHVLWVEAATVTFRLATRVSSWLAHHFLPTKIAAKIF